MIHGSSSSALQRSHSSGSLASDLSYTTARSQVSPSPLSTGRGSSAASTFSTPSAASRASAGSRSAAPHLAIEMAGAPTMSASDRLEVRKVRDRLAAQIGALAQSLRADARAGTLVVPAEFAAPPGPDRQTAYAEHCVRELDRFADRISAHVIATGYTDETLMKAFDAVSRKDNRKAVAAGMVERFPFIASMALMNYLLPYGEAAAKVDSSKGAVAGAVTGGLTNASCMLLGQIVGPYARTVALGPNPFDTRPSFPDMDPALAQALKALSPRTLRQRFETAQNASMGLVGGNFVGGATATVLTGAGIAENRALPISIGARALTQLGLTGLSSAAANQTADRERFQQGLLPWIASTNFGASAQHAHDSMFSLRNVANVAGSTLQTLASPVTGLLPPALAPGFVGQPPVPPTASRWMPPLLQNLTHPDRYGGTAAFTIAGLATGAHSFTVANQLPGALLDVHGREAALATAVRSTGALLDTYALVNATAAGNAAAQHRVAMAGEAARQRTAAASAAAAVPPATGGTSPSQASQSHRALSRPIPRAAPHISFNPPDPSR